MSTRIDKVLLQVLIGGTDVTDNVESVQVKVGFDLRMSEATVTFIDTPSVWTPWAALIINAGMVDSGDAVNHGLLTRFNGFVLDPSVTNWPHSFDLAGRGPLVLADKTYVQGDAYSEAILAPVVPDTWWDVSSGQGWVDGIDLLEGDPAGQYDHDMVQTVLRLCGLNGRIGSTFGGIGTKLGTAAFDQFTWRVDQSGLSMIEALDKMYKFRTYESLAGDILRAPASAFAPFVQTALNITEGADILESSKLVRDTQNIKNMVAVRGYDDGSGPVIYYATGGVSILPPGTTYQNETLNSTMIEKTLAADPGDGLSCEEVALWLLGELKYPMFDGTVDTWRDDAFEPGQLIYLNAPHLLGVNQSIWVKSVTINVSPGKFTQTLGVRGQDYSSIVAGASLPIILPGDSRLGP